MLDGQLNRNLRRLALNDGERDAVHEQHDVRPRIVTLVLALDRKLLRHVEDVVSPILPVDVLQIEAEQFPFADRLLIAPSQ